jgi:8-amino-7-oxononanoate synthase
MKDVQNILNLIDQKKLYPDINIVNGGVSSDPEFMVANKRVLSFSSGNYLGLANDPQIKQAVISGIEKYGLHPSGSVLITGTLDIHRQLEQRLAKYLGFGDAMLFNTSTMANMGVIPAMINLPLISLLSFFKVFVRREKAVILSDELNHATVIEGCRLSDAERIVFKHTDIGDLERHLKKHRKRKKLIVTDGVFSMDGDIAPLPDIICLARTYNAMVMVDDAHATGVLGVHGRGTMEHFGLSDGVDILTTTFSKAFGVVGGATLASPEVIRYLRVSAKTYIFSGAFLGGIAAGVLKAIDIAEHDTERRKRLWENTDLLRRRLNEIGMNTLGSKTQIIPILIGNEQMAVDMSRELLDKGILAPPVRWPAVPHGQARMRFALTPDFTSAQIEQLVTALDEVARLHGLTKKST